MRRQTYALAIAISAMLIGHLSFAGHAEAVISGGALAYVQKFGPRLVGLAVMPLSAAPGGGRVLRAAAIP